MLNLGTGEIVLIAVVALLVLGPARLPELARGIGKFIREFRRQTDDVRTVVEREFYRMDEPLPPAAPVAPPAPAAPALMPAEGLTAREALPAPDDSLGGSQAMAGLSRGEAQVQVVPAPAPAAEAPAEQQAPATQGDARGADVA